MSESFISKTARLFGGNMIGQMIVVLSAPILTRFYSPEEFGLLGSFMAVIAILSVFSTLRFESAIVLESSVIGEQAVMALCISLIAVSMTLASLCFYLLYWLNFLPSGILVLGNLIWLLPVGLVAVSVYKVLTWSAVKAQSLEDIGIARVYQNTTMASLQTVFGGVGLGPSGLILGQLIGLLSGIVRLSHNVNFKFIYRIIISRKSYMKFMAVKYARFFKYSLPGDVMNVFAQQLPVILLASIFSPTIAGFYVLADKVFRSPLLVFSDAVSKSVMSVAVKCRENGTLGLFTLLFLKLLIRLSSVAFIIFALISPKLFEILFGLNWVEAGVYAQLMTPAFFTIFIFVPVLAMLVILERQELEFLYQASLLIGVLSALIFGYLTKDSSMTILFLSISGTIFYSFFGVWALFLTGVTLNNIILFFLKEATIIIVLGGILYAAYLDLTSYIFNGLVFWPSLVIFLIYIVFTFYDLKKKLRELGHFADKLLIGKA